jgi:HK97 family phage major capsid protein
MEDWGAVEAEITEGATEEFEYNTGIAYVSGNGVGRPMGFTTNVDVDDAIYPKSVTGAGTQLISADDFAKMQVALPTRYWPNSTWCFNSVSLGNILNLKATTGNYLWQPGLQAGLPNIIFGRPFVIMETLPNEGNDVFPLWFGDFRQGYLIVDRQGIKLLKDPYTSWPSVNFNWRIRTGGQVVKAEAIKALKTT